MEQDIERRLRLELEDRALRGGDLASLRRLVSEFGGEPNTLLRRACKISSPEVCKELVMLGASVKKMKGRLVGTVLHDAVEAGRVGICRALVDCGADPTFTHVSRSLKSVLPSDERRFTPFLRAVRDGHEEIVRFFVLECGVDPVGPRTDAGRTALQIASRAFQPYLRSMKIEFDLKEQVRGVVGEREQSTRMPAPI